MSDPILSKEALLKTGLPEEAVEIKNLGMVRVRSISRGEFVRIREMDLTEFETQLVAMGLVEPRLTEDEVKEWRDSVTPHVFDDLAGEILRVSGLRKALDEAMPAQAKPSVAAADAQFPDGPDA